MGIQGKEGECGGWIPRNEPMRFNSFAPPSGRNRQGHFLVNFSRFLPRFQSILVDFSLTFSQF